MGHPVAGQRADGQPLRGRYAWEILFLAQPGGGPWPPGDAPTATRHQIVAAIAVEIDSGEIPARGVKRRSRGEEAVATLEEDADFGMIIATVCDVHPAVAVEVVDSHPHRVGVVNLHLLLEVEAAVPGAQQQ